MENQQKRKLTTDLEQTPCSGGSSTGKHEWQEPKLRFVEPKLVERGAVKDLTGGFFGAFSP